MWIEYACLSIPETCPWASAVVRYDWYSTHQVDADNGIGRLKAALDVLTGFGAYALGAIENDRDVCLSYQWHKVHTKGEERVRITITEVKS